MGRLALVLAAVCVITLTACGSVNKMTEVTLMSSKEEETKLNDGEVMLNYDFMDLKGNSIKLSDFEGQKVYIKYWTSWCPICLGGLEDINNLSAEDTDFKVLTIVPPGYKGEKTSEDFKTWFEGVENTENITVLLDEDGVYTKQAGVRGFPTSAYIGSDGILVKTVPGYVDNDAIKDSMSKIQ